MSEEYGSDFITIIDDDGEEFELEVLDSMERVLNIHLKNDIIAQP